MKSTFRFILIFEIIIIQCYEDYTFTQMHIEAGAKKAFCRYNMPIEYSGIKDEHMTVEME